MKREDLNAVLERHAAWLRKESGGVRANLSDAYLSRADLSDADLSRAYLSRADLSDADLSRANLSDAYLSGANLSDANLSDAYLSGANLSGANLSDAYLSRADLSGAKLSRAKNIKHNLAILRDQPGPLRAFKLVNGEGKGIYQGGLTYEVGEEYTEPDADTDERILCARGLHVATRQWCEANYMAGYRLLEVEFLPEDIAAIPYATDGKFRVRRLKVIRVVEIRSGVEEKSEEVPS